MSEKENKSTYNFTIEDGSELKSLDLSEEGWKKLITATQKIDNLKIESPKTYLGDPKWVLYQMVCDLNSNKITFICGKYAFSKIRNLQGFELEKLKTNSYDKLQFGYLDLNGEKIKVYCLDNFDKKKLLIAKEYCGGYLDEFDIERKKYITETEIELEFA